MFGVAQGEARGAVSGDAALASGGGVRRGGFTFLFRLDSSMLHPGAVLTPACRGTKEFVALPRRRADCRLRGCVFLGKGWPCAGPQGAVASGSSGRGRKGGKQAGHLLRKRPEPELKGVGMLMKGDERQGTF